MNNKTICFFMRAYDDIDQITPTIYRFVKYFSANGNN